jgi:hypothetical protein
VADYLLKRKPLLLEKTFPRSPAQGCIVCTWLLDLPATNFVETWPVPTHAPISLPSLCLPDLVVSNRGPPPINGEPKPVRKSRRMS